MKFRILDIWHGKPNRIFIYSDDKQFPKLSDFFWWIEQHQTDYKGLEIINHPEKPRTTPARICKLCKKPIRKGHKFFFNENSTVQHRWCNRPDQY